LGFKEKEDDDHMVILRAAVHDIQEFLDHLSIESLFGIGDSSKKVAKHLLQKSTNPTLSNWTLLKAPSPGPF
jgi:hypothetical protein